MNHSNEAMHLPINDAANLAGINPSLLASSNGSALKMTKAGKVPTKVARAKECLSPMITHDEELI
jgi:hypothetical protein